VGNTAAHDSNKEYSEADAFRYRALADKAILRLDVIAAQSSSKS
jgi:hypothetical protein